MRVKRAENAVDGRSEELPIGRLVDIVGPYDFQYFAEQLDLTLGFDGGRRGPVWRDLGVARHDAEHEHSGDGAGDDSGAPRHGISSLVTGNARDGLDRFGTIRRFLHFHNYFFMQVCANLASLRAA